MKFTIINIKQVQLLTTTIVIVATLLLFGGSSVIKTILYTVTISLEMKVLIFWH